MADYVNLSEEKDQYILWEQLIEKNPEKISKVPNKFMEDIIFFYIQDNIFRKYDLFNGRMITSSKSFYKRENPDNLVVFNAGIAFYDENGRIYKIFGGDIDITKESEKLIQISKELKQILYIFNEYDFCYLEEIKDFDKAIWNSNSDIKNKNHQKIK